MGRYVLHRPPGDGRPAGRGRHMRVEIGPGVAELLGGLGEQALTVELTVDFENDATKSAVAFPGAGEPSLGFERVRVGGLDVWWRQRLVVGGRGARLSSELRPRRVVVGRVGRALSAEVNYA